MKIIKNLSIVELLQRLISYQGIVDWLIKDVEYFDSFHLELSLSVLNLSTLCAITIFLI